MPAHSNYPKKHRDRSESIARSGHGARELEESDYYVHDWRGDPRNVDYGSIHRYEIPPYRRAGFGRVIGCSTPVRIDNSLSTDRAIYLRCNERESRRDNSRPLLSKREKPNDSRYKVVAHEVDTGGEFDADFVHLRQPTKRRRLSTEIEREQSSSAYPDYRSIEGKAKALGNTEDGLVKLASGSGSGDDGLDLELSSRQENSRLLSKARADPRNIDAWLELSAHQAQLVHPGPDPTALTTSLRHSLAELRLSVLNQASKHIGKGDASRGLLLTSLLEEGGFLWDKTKLDAKWKDALLECPYDFELRKRYLDHVQSAAHAFTYDQCKRSFTQVLGLFKSQDLIARGTGRQMDLIYVLMRFARFILDAGFCELATAIWQALLEFRFFRPSHLFSGDTQALLDSFEEFWESDVPRIGECRAPGWNKAFECSQDLKRVESEPNNAGLPSEIVTFADRELQLSGTGILPASSEDTTEDPFQFVVFNDLHDVIGLQEAYLPEDGIINAFLASHGLPLMAIDGAKVEVMMFMTDPFLVKRTTEPSRRRGLEEPSDASAQVFRLRRESSMSLYGDAFASIKPGPSVDREMDPNLFFLDRCLESLVSVLPQNEALAEYFLAWKLHLFPEAVSKIAKRLLKTRSSSLRLYNALALLEAVLGRQMRAKDVWTTAIKMRASVSEDMQEEIILLCHSSMRTFARQGDENTALTFLYAFTDETANSSGSASQQLRLAQALRTGLERTLMTGHIMHATLYADSMAWLAYLTSQHDISIAFQTYHLSTDKIVREAGPEAAELLAQAKGALLKHHLAQKRPFKPAAWADELRNDLLRFPANSILLALHTQMSSHDRLRNIMRQEVPSDVRKITVVEWSFKISEEIKRSLVDGSSSNTHTVRALFTKALQHPESAVNHSAELWAWWLRFEYQHLSILSASDQAHAWHRIHQIVLDGLRLLPWHRTWTLLGMLVLGNQRSFQAELRQMYESLMERGLRIRMDVDRLR